MGPRSPPAPKPRGAEVDEGNWTPFKCGSAHRSTVWHLRQREAWRVAANAMCAMRISFYEPVVMLVSWAGGSRFIGVAALSLPFMYGLSFLFLGLAMVEPLSKDGQSHAANRGREELQVRHSHVVEAVNYCQKPRLYQLQSSSACSRASRLHCGLAFKPRTTTCAQHSAAHSGLLGGGEVVRRALQ